MKNPKGVAAFGTHIRQLRDELELSQEQLANDCDLSKKTIQRIENSKTAATIDVLLSLSKGSKIPLTKLVNFTIPKEKETKEKDRSKKKK